MVRYFDGLLFSLGVERLTALLIIQDGFERRPTYLNLYVYLLKLCGLLFKLRAESCHSAFQFCDFLVILD